MINRRFIVYKTYAAFKAALTEGIISPESIVFVEDASIIWTHEKEYICAGYGEQLEELSGKIVNIEDLLVTFALKENIPTKVSQLDNDSNYVVQELLDLKADKDSVSSNMTTLTVAQYLALVDAGQVQSDMYYFTYEGEAETGSWSFGDQFPIILTENWTFGGTFPITLN